MQVIKMKTTATLIIEKHADKLLVCFVNWPLNRAAEIIIPRKCITKSIEERRKACMTPIQK